MRQPLNHIGFDVHQLDNHYHLRDIFESPVRKEFPPRPAQKPQKTARNSFELRAVLLIQV